MRAEGLVEEEKNPSKGFGDDPGMEMLLQDPRRALPPFAAELKTATVLREDAKETVMKSTLRARPTRTSLKPSSLPASEATHTRSNAPPRARSAMTHVMPGRVTRAPPRRRCLDAMAGAAIFAEALPPATDAMHERNAPFNR